MLRTDEQPTATDSELLIREARRRQRRRRRRWIGLASASVLVAAAVAVVLSGAQSTPTSGRSGSPQPGPPTTGRAVLPKAPAALATGPDGSLYLIDTGRNEILRYTTKTGFRVVAGDGQKGWSPDGTAAARARLDLQWFSGLTVAGGAVYFTDEGRIREISPTGTLVTVAGGGKVKLARQPVAARRADLSAVGDGLAGLTVGPGHDLYVATAAGIYRLHDGLLHWVVGRTPSTHSKYGTSVIPANPGDFTYVTHLAFDSRGDLFAAGGGGWGLYERTAAGRLRFIENLRGTGGLPGSVTVDPAGTVIAASGRGLQRILPDGSVRPLPAHWPQTHGARHERFVPNFGVGVATGSDGQVFVDTDSGDTFPNQGLLDVSPSGRVRWLWTQPA